MPAADALATRLVPETATIARPVRVSRRASPRDSLVIGYPMKLLGESTVFGGVITRVSEPDDPALGSLKLTQLEPLHVRPFLAQTDEGDYALALIGCARTCTETSPQETLLTIPVRGVGAGGKELFLDVARLGEGLGIGAVLDPGQVGLVEVEARTTFVDYSMSTLVFDVESTMLPAGESDVPAALAQGEEPAPIVVTTRWYLRLGSGFQDAFGRRAPIPELGFFTTSRSALPLITRFAATRYRDRPPVKYYIKNVPVEYRDAFSAAFADWNEVFREVLGYDLLDYEHVGADDRRNALIVDGDVRFHVIEWDLDNLAYYGGLGPSVAHQFTGETFSGTILIQGPQVVRLYRDWFDVVETAGALRAAGKTAEAERALAEGHRRVRAQIVAPPGGTSVHQGQLEMAVPSENPALHDPVMSHDYFEPTPPGVSFADYMQGYFREMVAHELGHTLGLYHNFKGSLGGNGEDRATHSVMEYCVQTERHKARVGEYDRQAIAYGYAGERPEEALPFCNDFEYPWMMEPTLSAECSPSDAGPDPFAYYREQRVRRAMDLVIGRGLGAEPPVWTPDDVAGPLGSGLRGMAFYATSAEATAHTWINFYSDPQRPTEPQAIREYVIAEIQGAMCEPSIADEIRAKHALDPRAGQLARDNWAAVLEQARVLGQYLGLPLGDCDRIGELPF
ncbi:MAG TPA: zinc-dependent metalloprotease [Haliangium sp.]|nr:zinc-dependent metalloprotease [Haliangium sp.]